MTKYVQKSSAAELSYEVKVYYNIITQSYHGDRTLDKQTITPLWPVRAGIELPKSTTLSLDMEVVEAFFSQCVPISSLLQIRQDAHASGNW